MSMMSATRDELINSNTRYAGNFGSKADLPAPPYKKIAILTCMDARLDPAGFGGLELGDAHIIRNAGGRASEDAIRSLVVSHKLLGTEHWFVIHHTDCGMATVDNEIMGKLLSESLETARFDRHEWQNARKEGGSEEGRFMDWLPISNPRESVLEDVKRIREHPLVSDKISVYGFIYDVKTGRLEEIPSD